MIISKTPYRISFFGGGTDYHKWYEKHGGDVLSTSINHYNYISCRYLPPFHSEYRNKIVWKIIEYINNINDIQHNAIREALKYYKLTDGVEIINQCDLPARSGLGSSSAFCVSLINSIYSLRNEPINKYNLASAAIKLEREILCEHGGIQDQIATTFGGFNHIHINKDGSFVVNKLNISTEKKHKLNSKLMLFFTGVSRTSSIIAEKQSNSIPDNAKQLTEMQNMVIQAKEILLSKDDNLADFGYLLNNMWLLKKSLNSSISNEYIDKIYKIGLDNGALGGKILGSGGGGFILFYADEKYQENIKNALNHLTYVPFKFENKGCTTIYKI